MQITYLHNFSTRPVIIIAISEFYDEKIYKPNVSLSLNKIGNIFNILNNNDVKQVLFIGSVTKPTLHNLKPNLLTIYYILLIIL